MHLFTNRRREKKRCAKDADNGFFLRRVFRTWWHAHAEVTHKRLVPQQLAVCRWFPVQRSYALQSHWQKRYPRGRGANKRDFRPKQPHRNIPRSAFTTNCRGRNAASLFPAERGTAAGVQHAAVTAVKRRCLPVKIPPTYYYGSPALGRFAGALANP